MQAQFHHLEQQDKQWEQREMQREQHDNQIHQLLQQLVNNQQAGQTPQTPRIDEGPRTNCWLITQQGQMSQTYLQLHQMLLWWLIVLQTWMSCLSQFFQQ
jgi:hypothetical protein